MFDNIAHVPIGSFGSDGCGTDGNNGTVRHVDLPKVIHRQTADTAQCHNSETATVAKTRELPSAIFAPAANDLVLHHHSAHDPASVSREINGNPLASRDSTTPQPTGETYAAPPSGNSLPGGDYGAPGLSFDIEQYPGGASTAAGCHPRAITAVGGPAGIAAGTGQWPRQLSSSDSVSIDMPLAREGAAIAAAIARREQLQYFEDLIADAIYDAELGNLPHRRTAEAVLASLLNAGVVR
jgi:hypothetical protein